MLETLLYLFFRTVQLFLGFFHLAMLARAILSWFIQDENNRLMMFLVLVTEPIILPARFVCSKIRSLDRMVLDIPFFITFMILAILTSILPTITL